MLAGFLFLLFLAKQGWPEIEAHLSGIHLLGFIASVLFSFACNLVLAFYFQRLLGKHGISISLLVAIKMHMVGQIAKYIPGKVWAIAYQASFTESVKGAAGVFLANVEMMLCTMYMTLIVGLALVLSVFSYIYAALALFSGGVVFVLLFKTNLIGDVFAFFSRKYKQLALFECAHQSHLKSLDGALIFILFVVSFVLSNGLMLTSVFHFSMDVTAIYIAMLAAAWLAGVFVFVVPAGMGAREIIFVLISSYMDPEQSIATLTAISVFSRFWLILQELCLLFLLKLLCFYPL